MSPCIRTSWTFIVRSTAAWVYAIATSSEARTSRLPAGSGQIICSRERTDDVLPTEQRAATCPLPASALSSPSTGGGQIMARIKLIHHINVQIGDRARTREWYEKVLGAEFLDRGPALNKRQLQLRLGNGEIHFTETSRPTTIASGHFALEVDDWEAMLSRLDAIGVKHVRTSAASTMPNIGGADPHQGRREDTGEHYTY